MKTIILKIGIITCTVLFISCHQNDHHTSSGSGNIDTLSEVSALKDQIMTIHDESMDKIAPVRRVEDSIREKIKIFTEERKDTINLSKTATALNHDDTAIFGWMDSYHNQITSPDSSNVKLLKQRLQSLEQISTSMDSVVKKGRELLN